LSSATPESFRRNFPEVDAFVGSGDYMRVAEVLKKVVDGKRFVTVHRPAILPS